MSGIQWNDNDWKIGDTLRIRLPKDYIVRNERKAHSISEIEKVVLKMKYLIGKSKHTGNVYAGLLPDDAHLEPENNREYEKEISKEEFYKLKFIDVLPIKMNGVLYEIHQVQE